MNKKLYCIGLASYACPPPPWRLRIYINMAISSGRLVVNTTHFCRAMLCISAAYAVMRCLSACVSVCHVRGFCQNE